MGNSSTPEDASTTGDVAVPSDVVLEALQRIVTSDPFAKSPRSRDFLAYVVTETVMGRGHKLKERTVARGALSRPDSFDARDDAGVRVQAGRVRTALDSYYAAEGAQCDIRIELPRGTYQPIFTTVAEAPDPQEAVTPTSHRTLGPGVIVVELAATDGNSTTSAQAVGITDSLVAALSRFPGIRVVGPVNRAGPQPGQTEERRLGARLDVRYILRGSVRTIIDLIRVSVRLVDAENGEIVWTSTIDRTTAEFSGFSGEDVIAQEIAGIIGDYSGVVLHHSRTTAATTNPVVVAAMLQYYDALEQNTPDAGASAKNSLLDAIALEPENPYLLSMLASTEAYAAIFASGVERAAAADRGEHYARAALAIDSENGHPHLVLGMVALSRDHQEIARQELVRAIELAPFNPSILYGAGWYLALAGEWDLGISHIRESTRLNPARPSLRYLPLAVDRLMVGDNAGALVDATRYTAKDDFWPPLLRALALAGLGYLDEAEHELGECHGIDPTYRGVVAWWPDLPEDVRAFLVTRIDDLTEQLAQ